MVHRIKKETTNYELQTTNRKSKGFTLIELLVVISIIAILMAVATISYLNAQQKGRDNKRKSDLKAVQQALEIYYNQNGKYPFLSVSGNGISCTNGGTKISWGAAFSCSGVTYMNPLPTDPIQTTTTNYYYWSNNGTTPANQTYQLYAKIENTKDQDLANTTQSLCTSGTPPGGTYTTATYYYCVVNP